MIILSWNSPFSDCNTRISVSRRFLPWTIEIMSFCAVIRLEWLVLFLCCLYKWWLQDSLFKTEREVLTLLVIDAFRSILFVSVFDIRFVAWDRPFWGNHRLVRVEDFFRSFFFLSLATIKQCLPPSLDKNPTNHGDFLRYSCAVYIWRVILSFVFAGKAWWSALNYNLHYI